MRRLPALITLAVLAGCAVPVGGGDTAGRTDAVERVVDGDTVDLRSLGRARVIGVDTPEVYGGAECFGREASAYAKRRLPSGTEVTYELGADPRDRYDRTLVYLRAGGRMFNEDLLEAGYATPLAIEPNTRYEERFDRLATRAAGRHRGIWGACPRP